MLLSFLAATGWPRTNTQLLRQENSRIFFVLLVGVIGKAPLGSKGSGSFVCDMRAEKCNLQLHTDFPELPGFDFRNYSLRILS